MTARDDLEAVVRRQLTVIRALGRLLSDPTQRMNAATAAILAAADRYAIEYARTDGDPPDVTAARRQVLADADTILGRRR